MAKRFVGILVVGAAALFAAGSGCSSEATPAGTSDAASAPVPDAAPTPVTDSAPPKPPARPDAAPASCFDESAAIGLKKETLEPKAGRGVCTPAQVADYLKACLTTGATAATCKVFTDNTANAACKGCISGGGTPPEPPVLLPANQAGNRVYANVYACGYLVIGKPDCANTAASFRMCTASTCDACATAERTACEKTASDGVCKQFAVSAACQTAYDGAKTAIDAACRASDFAGSFTKIANYLCGSAGADGGADAATDADDDGG